MVPPVAYLPERRVPRSDPELVQACLAGDADAWDTLVERYSRLIYSIPVKLGLATSDADDVLQSVLAIVLRKLADLKDNERLSAWLIRTTYREAWKQTNRGRRGRGQVLTDRFEAEEEPAVEELDRLEREQIVREAMLAIDERCRKLVEAFFFEAEPASYETLAIRLGMPVGSLGPTRARCFKKLEQELRNRGI